MKHLWVLIVLCSVALGGQAQTLDAIVEAREITENTAFQVVYKSDVAMNNFEAPSFEPFKVVSGPAVSRSMRIINGQRSETNSYTYTLLAGNAGTYTIPPAKMQVGNKVIQSQALDINIQKAQDITMLGGVQDVFVRMEVSDSVGYIGQRIVLEYIMYTNTTVAGIGFVSQSDFKDFHEESGVSPRGYRQVKVNGKDYYARTLLTYYLYPQKTGVFHIEPYIIEIGLPVKGGRRDIFGRVESRSEYYTSNDLSITIQNLPDGAPEGFSGAVGRFEMTASVADNTYETDEAIVVEMEVEGTGDPKKWSAPDQSPVENLELYEPKTIAENPSQHNFGEATTKVFEYIYLPKKAGNYMIEPVFTYFDTDSLKYITLTEGPFNIEVKQGEETAIETDLGKDLPKNLDASDEEESPWLWWGIGLTSLVILAFGMLMYKKREKDTVDPEVLRKEKAGKVAIETLAHAKSLIQEGNTDAFYTELSLALNRFLGDKYDVQSSQRTQEHILKVLKQHNIQDHHITEYLDIMQKCELALYARKTHEDMLTDYERAKRLIMEMVD